MLSPSLSGRDTGDMLHIVRAKDTGDMLQECKEFIRPKQPELAEYNTVTDELYHTHHIVE